MRRVATGALALALLMLAGCRDSGPTHTLNDRVLIVGDSNVFISANAIDENLKDASFEPIVHGLPAVGLKDFDEYWEVTVPELLDTDPAIVVVALGTNDTVERPQLEQVPARIDQMMKLFGDREAIWITVQNERPGALSATAGRQVNDDLRAAEKRWKNLTLLDWAAVIDSDPSVLRPDGLHWSPNGAQRYARRIRDEVIGVYDRCGGIVVAGCA